MTFEEMKALTNRFNQIKQSHPALRNKRFEAMLDDLILLYRENDMFAESMYTAVCEEMENVYEF